MGPGPLCVEAQSAPNSAAATVGAGAFGAGIVDVGVGGVAAFLGGDDVADLPHVVCGAVIDRHVQSRGARFQGNLIADGDGGGGAVGHAGFAVASRVAAPTVQYCWVGWSGFGNLRQCGDEGGKEEESQGSRDDLRWHCVVLKLFTNKRSCVCLEERMCEGSAAIEGSRSLYTSIQEAMPSMQGLFLVAIL